MEGTVPMENQERKENQDQKAKRGKKDTRKAVLFYDVNYDEGIG